MSAGKNCFVMEGERVVSAMFFGMFLLAMDLVLVRYSLFHDVLCSMIRINNVRDIATSTHNFLRVFGLKNSSWIRPGQMIH